MGWRGDVRKRHVPHRSGSSVAVTWCGQPLTTYRPMPADFPELFEQHGWEGISDATRAHRDTIKRWMLDYGEEELRARRRAFLEAKYAALGKRVPGARPGIKKRYVLGRTLVKVKPAVNNVKPEE